MGRSFKFVLCILVAVMCQNIDAQQKPYYKDVLLNGKAAKLNLATGEFILVGSNGNDSIVKANNDKEKFSLEDLDFHIVASGENMLMISEQYGLTLNELKRGNNLKTTLVRVGQKLRVRNFNKAKKEDSEDIWIVSKGDTLYEISRKTKVSVATLKRLNGLKNNTLNIGQKLFLK